MSFNNLTRLDEESLADLSSLSILRLSHNSISHIAEGAFKGLKNLRVLYVLHGGVDRMQGSLAQKAEQSQPAAALNSLLIAFVSESDPELTYVCRASHFFQSFN